MIRKKPVLFILIAMLTLFIIYVAGWLIRTDLLIKEKFASGQFVSPTQFFSRSLELTPNGFLQEAELLALLQSQNYRERAWGTRLQPSDYAKATGEECTKIYAQSLKCYAFYHHLKNKILRERQKDKIKRYHKKA